MKKILKRVTSAIAAAVLTISSLAFTSSASLETDQLAKRFLEGALKFQNKIDISDIVKAGGWNENNLASIVLHAFLYEPELFFVSNNISFSYNGSRYNILPQYTYTGTEYKEAKAKLDAAAKKAVEGITSDMTDVEKALYVHDYLILNCKYDYGKSGYDAYDCLVTKAAVCQGYALAYEYILRNYLGIECSIVYSDKMVHAWNYVRIGNNWYHVDVTKDDAATTYKDQRYDNYGVVMHTNFLLSDSAIRNTSEPHYDWKVIGDFPAATDKSFDNAFWKSTYSPIVCDGNLGYYAIGEDDSQTGTKYAFICSYDFKTGKNKRIAKIAVKWYAHRNESGTETYKDGSCSYLRIWMSLQKRGSKLYLNTNRSVYSFDINTKASKKIYTLDKGTDQIFGMMFTSPDRLRLAYRSDLTYSEKYLTLQFV